MHARITAIGLAITDGTMLTEIASHRMLYDGAFGAGDGPAGAVVPLAGAAGYTVEARRVGGIGGA
jgi:hypothetical protein